jgi:hypothetical protein
MSNEEVVGRIAALEVIAMTALGLCLAKNRNDPDHRKSNALLACMRDALKTHPSGNTARRSPAACDRLRPRRPIELNPGRFGIDNPRS